MITDHMWIVTGLGNPGSRYLKTRHNIGFMVIDLLSETLNIPLADKETYMFGRGNAEGKGVVLLKPLVFMNKSGIAVKKVLRKFNTDPEHLIVIHDDLDLGSGILKIRKNGSSGGHKGIDSIIQETGSREFIRVKLGIGRDNSVPVEKYVLSTFKPFEKEDIRNVIIQAVDVVRAIIRDDVAKAMNRYNRSAAPKVPRA